MRTTRSRTRSSGSGSAQINGDCRGEVNPAVDIVIQQGNASLPTNATSEAVSHKENIEESPNNVIENGHLHDEIMENGNGISGEEQILTPVTGKKSSNTKGSHRELVLGLPCRGQFEIHRTRMSATSSKRLGGGGERNVLFPSHKRVQISKETAASPSGAANPTLSVPANSTPSFPANPTPVDGPKKRKKNMNKGIVKEDDEYTKIKKKLRYLLNRINYEQNLIDAYSLEGWKGSSAEKLRPEKELERATKEILKRKVKIRDLFQHLDSLCAEGNLPESLFDSDGEIASEDIFCAKCGSKDLSADNDIILCDGFCDRGFHQYCVEPPLRNEDIPPDDEGWLCPGCDCKDDSLDLLNDSLGTKLLISDTWEKVFPEAAAALAGGVQNLNCDLPSDDSDDEEYNPDGLNDNGNDEDGSDDNEESENEDGSSDESDFSSASDEMLGSLKEANDIMGLPSDDSEDDDYDPDALTFNEDKIQDGSNSDCSSDSEDPETSSKDEESNQQDEVMLNGESGIKSQLPDASISESDAELDRGLSDVPARRKVERLDYKKLYDEEYENVSTSSSDDEDWDKTAEKQDFESADEVDTVPVKQSSQEEDDASAKKPPKNAKRTNKIDILKPPQETPEGNGCSSKKSSSSTHKKSDPRTQILYRTFQENRYPDKATRESLAKELQLTMTQVNNWFKNRRSSTSKPFDTVVSKEDVEKLRTAKECEGETSVAGSSKQAIETESAAENKSRASEATNPGSRKRRSGISSDAEETAGKGYFESAGEVDTVPVRQSSKEEDDTSSKKPRRNAKRTDEKDNLKPPQETPEENGCSSKKSSSSTQKKPDPRTERLFKTFQENRYPDPATKESLAKELQMTMKQVDNWFRNRRSSTSKPLVTVVSKEDVEKLRTAKECKGETSVAGSSKQAMETEPAAEDKSRASEATSPGSRKRRR